MEKENAIKEISERFREKEKNLKIMFEITKQIGYNTNEGIELIREFYTTCPKLVR